MDQQEVRSWIDFCEGKSLLSSEQFSGLFMELYSAPLTDKDKDDLRSIFGAVPNSAEALDRMFRLDALAVSKSEDEIIDLVRRDLLEMRQLVTSPILLDAMNAPIEITLVQDAFQQVCDCEMNRLFFHEMATRFVEEMARHHSRIRGLSNAFYGLASNVHLQWALTADLLDIEANFDNYFELYLVGIDYAVGNNHVLAMNYRARMTRDD